MTRQQIKDNRLKFANGLLEPHRMKFKARLENTAYSNERCCLGHGCEIFNISKRETLDYGVLYGDGIGASNSNAPNELMELLGLYQSLGGSKDCQYTLYQHYTRLCDINDQTELTTQEIGQLILDRGWIEGGVSTPFKPLSDYPESED